jgi:hypothetical protein
MFFPCKSIKSPKSLDPVYLTGFFARNIKDDKNFKNELKYWGILKFKNNLTENGDPGDVP